MLPGPTEQLCPKAADGLSGEPTAADNVAKQGLVKVSEGLGFRISEGLFYCEELRD